MFDKELMINIFKLNMSPGYSDSLN